MERCKCPAPATDMAIGHLVRKPNLVALKLRAMEFADKKLPFDVAIAAVTKTSLHFFALFCIGGSQGISPNPVFLAKRNLPRFRTGCDVCTTVKSQPDFTRLKAATTSEQLQKPWHWIAQPLCLGIAGHCWALLGIAGHSGQTPSDARFMVRSGALKVSLKTAIASIIPNRFFRTLFWP